MTGGAALGVGFGMAQAMGQQFAGQPAQPATQAPAGSGGSVTCPSCNATVGGGKFCAECGTGFPA